MKKTTVTIFSLLFFLISHAQVAKFLSLQFAVSSKSTNGEFAQVKEWIGQEIYIHFDLSRKKVQFFSKGMLDRDRVSLKKEILIQDQGIQSDTINDKMWQLPGTDRTGKKCTISLKLIKDPYNLQDGELRIEYLEKAEIYKIRKVRRNMNNPVV